MSLQIYNTLTQKKEEFKSIDPKLVKMYLCGPTVYNLLHVGNFRGAVFFNLVRNWLEHLGYSVKFVYNFTDVDDKIIEKANAEGKTSIEISEKYIEEFKKDFQVLKLKAHDANPKVTETMGPICSMVEEIIKRGHGYVINGEVLYKVRSKKDYGKLSHKNIDELESGARVNVVDHKEDPLDFVLWKPAKPGEPSWASPWGEGRPGWHIECSAMIKNFLGDEIDIHGGGSDLIFPHHENEIAQSEGANGKPFVRYWMHNNMLTFGDRKMSKSLGNIKTTREFLNEYGGEVLKYLLLSAHYRSLSDFSSDTIHQTVVSLGRIYSALRTAEEIIKDAKEKSIKSDESKLAAEFLNFKNEVNNALNDDFSTPQVLANIFNLVRSFNAIAIPYRVTPLSLAASTRLIENIKYYGNLCSLFSEPAHEYLMFLDDIYLKKKNLIRSEIDQLVHDRFKARVDKNFKRADEIRDQLKTHGIMMHDSPSGTRWEVEK